MSTFSTGIQGEEIACRHLAAKGYRILERNWRGGRSEIDIIARDGDTVVFCEVKTARTALFGPPLSWVTPAKTRRIANAARGYIASHPDITGPFRFDVVACEVGDSRLTVTHIPNAFPAPEE